MPKMQRKQHYLPNGNRITKDWMSDSNNLFNTCNFIIWVVYLNPTITSSKNTNCNLCGMPGLWSQMASITLKIMSKKILKLIEIKQQKPPNYNT